MKEEMLNITAIGEKNADSNGTEVILLGFRSDRMRRLEASAEHLGAGWSVMMDVDAGPEIGRVGVGLRGFEGETALPCRRRARLILLMHPWSGHVRISFGDWTEDFDLYSPTTRAISVDVPEGRVASATRADLERMRLAPASTSTPVVRLSGSHLAGEGELAIRATGRASWRSEAAAVTVLQVEPVGYGIALDLSKFAEPGGDWALLPHGIETSKGYWPSGLRSEAGILRLSCDPHGRVVLLRDAQSGVAEVAYGDTSVEIDLFAPEPSVLQLTVNDLAAMAISGLDDTEKSAEAPGVTGRLGSEKRRAHYERLCTSFDSRQPIALYVPRWHGVAASTRALFDQVLPLPEGATTHPDEITESDIEEYAEILVDTGCRHFVISGGDLFNLAIIDRVQELAPETRFDQLWHSNFLQMGEAHDWNLLRHWLSALNEGTITRVGVVKEGLDRWFAQLGLDAVFLPNIVEVDPAWLTPSGITDRVGVWLSGSSAYRKLPHAVLMGLRIVPEVTLKGSGLDSHSLRMVNDLGLRFSQLSTQPLPHAKLMRQIRTTGLSLYVTVSECSPMLPLESFSVGVPCLVGPSSHLFRNHDRLREALVVDHPDSPGEIAEKVRHALANQESIIADYLDYHAAEKVQAKEGVRALLA